MEANHGFTHIFPTYHTHLQYLSFYLCTHICICICILYVYVCIHTAYIPTLRDCHELCPPSPERRPDSFLRPWESQRPEPRRAPICLSCLGFLLKPLFKNRELRWRDAWGVRSRIERLFFDNRVYRLGGLQGTRTEGIGGVPELDDLGLKLRTLRFRQLSDALESRVQC